MAAGSEVALKIDQTLTQDATGTMAYLEFETMGIPRVRTELSVAYIDHNTIQSGFENADDHRFIQSMAKKYGLKFSRPGNGICHQVHLERFGKPGRTLPYEFYEKFGIRRYGFHGTSHRYVAERASDILNHTTFGCTANASKTLRCRV